MKTSLFFVSIFLASSCCLGIHLSKGSPGSLPMLHHQYNHDQMNRPLTMTAPSNHLTNYDEIQGKYFVVFPLFHVVLLSFHPKIPGRY